MAADNFGQPEWDWRRRWLHRLTMATAALTFLMLLSGGQVTSYDVGMAVPDWPTTFGENMLTYSWLNEPLGVFVEHRHRLVGVAVGICAIVVCAGFWTLDRSKGRAWLSTLVLAFIVFQGILGGMRVQLNAMGIGRELAVCHGIFAQICFALLIALATVSSRGWLQSQRKPHYLARSLSGALMVACIFIPVQMLFGALQRHIGFGFIPHLVMAGAWVLFVLWLNFVVYFDGELRQRLGSWPGVLAGLTTLQLFLGLGALWATRLLPPGWGKTPSAMEALLPTFHLGMGALVFGTVVALTLLASRRLAVEPATASARGYAMEGTP